MTPSSLDRRSFLATALTGSISLTTLAGASTAEAGPALPRRPLGSTGLHVSVLGLGCATIGTGADRGRSGEDVIETCIDSGINYIDCASTYGRAEEAVGRVMRNRRKEVILATKMLERTKDAAWREFNRSLERLQTDRVDILQVHAVNSPTDLERIRARDGALAAAVKAKDQGLCGHIGITGHARADVIVDALALFPFETVLIPLSSVDALVQDFGSTLFPLAAERGFGILAMKVLSATRLSVDPSTCIRYSVSLPVSAAVVGMGSVDEVRSNVGGLQRFSSMKPEDMRELEERTRPLATKDAMWWKRG